MLGAIAGDMIGAAHEWKPLKTVDFELFGPGARFTDDTVLTVATAHALMEGHAFDDAYRAYFKNYPDAGYGGNFARWARAPDMPAYGSYGNGSAMRVAPVGWVFRSLSDVLEKAEASASVTHNHPEGIKGAQAVAGGVFLARTGADKDDLADFWTKLGYDVATPLDTIRPAYAFDVTCQGSVPQALRCFLESRSFEEAVRLAVSLGGDADTQACMAGAVAEAFYNGVPSQIAVETLSRLDRRLRNATEEFLIDWVPHYTSYLET